jgi:hypothetical protein
MYDVIGNITDNTNTPIAGVIVDDGVNGTSTNASGYYELKTDKKIINFRMISYKPQAFNLSVYKPNSSVNVDVTLLPDTEGTTYKPLEIIAKRTQTPQQIVIEEKGLTKKQMKVIGFSLIGVALILSSILIYKAVKKN